MRARKCLMESLEPRRLLASISGVIFNDANSNGLRDAGEGTVNCTVFIDRDNSGTLSPGDTSTNSASGAYQFSNLAAGSYRIYIILPANTWRQTYPNYVGTYQYVTVTAAENRSGVDFGATNASGSISVSIFSDANGNGVRDASEGGAANITVWADFNDDMYEDPNEPLAKTDSAGNVTLRAVPPGTHIVRFQAASGYAQSTPANGVPLRVTVGSGNVFGGTFGTAPGSFFGRVSGADFEDLNVNGIFDAGEPGFLRERRIYVDLNNDGQLQDDEPSFKTEVDGYSFDSLRPGTYVLRQIVPAGWWATAPYEPDSYPVTVTAGMRIRLDFGTIDHEISPPHVINAQFLYDRLPHEIRITFDKPIDTNTLFASDLQLKPDWGVSMRYDPATNTAIFSPSGRFADGNYSASLAKDSFKDASGNFFLSNFSFNFFALTGDLNRDGTVSIADFITLSSNFGKIGASYADGDINYDGTVTIADFIDLTANFNKTLASPAPAAPQPAADQTISIDSVASSILKPDDQMPGKNKLKLKSRSHSGTIFKL